MTKAKVESKVIQMKFGLIQLGIKNNIPPLEFINFLFDKHKDMVKVSVGKDNLPFFEIEAKNIKAAVTAYKKSQKNFFQRLFNL